VLTVVIVLVVAAFLFASPRRPPAGTPEQAADLLFRQLRSGDFDAAFKQLPPGGINRDAQLREQRYRLRWWWLIGREQKGTELKLRYRVLRGWIPIPSPVWVTVANRDGKWRAVDFDAWY
jgi:hypothetical protein